MRAFSVKNKFIPARCTSEVVTFKEQPGNIIIVSPHPDDDVLGVGGTMTLLAHGGMNVFSLYITDGRGSPRGASGATSGALASVRQQEALEALKIVRARGALFLGYRSESLLGSGRTAAGNDIAGVFKFFLPESVYVPSPLDRHPTHQAVTDIVISALRRIRGYSPILWGYSVWGGAYPKQGLTPVDISTIVKRKQKAIRMHQSQISYKAYDAGMLGRNRYEAVFLDTHEPEKFQYVEMVLDMQELLKHKNMTIKSFVNKLVTNLW